MDSYEVIALVAAAGTDDPEEAVVVVTEVGLVVVVDVGTDFTQTVRPLVESFCSFNYLLCG